MRSLISLVIACSLLVVMSLRSKADDAPPSFLDQLKAAVAGAVNKATSSVESAKVESETEVTWHATLEEAVEDARKSGKPIFAIVGAPWCSFCEKLQAELKGEPEKEIAKTWVLAKINADDQVTDARELHANALPALRLLSSDGIVAVSRDGYAPVSQLTLWLDQSYELTKAQMPGLLAKEIEELDEIETLIGLMATRDVTARRVVLSRLIEMPQQAALPAIELLARGRLANQLSALQLLRKWEAPIDGLDPWEPSSITDAAVERLETWGQKKYLSQIPNTEAD